MSLVTKLKPHIEAMKVHKPPMDLSRTERRLNLMTAIILNKTMSKADKDAKLKDLVADSQVEKMLRTKGIKL